MGGNVKASVEKFICTEISKSSYIQKCTINWQSLLKTNDTKSMESCLALSEVTGKCKLNIQIRTPNEIKSSITETAKAQCMFSPGADYSRVYS